MSNLIMLLISITIKKDTVKFNIKYFKIKVATNVEGFGSLKIVFYAF
jgi:hypothetical protein